MCAMIWGNMGDGGGYIVKLVHCKIPIREGVRYEMGVIWEGWGFMEADGRVYCGVGTLRYYMGVCGCAV